MLADFKTLPQLFDFFKDEQDCMSYWEHIRWNGNVTCAHCNAENPYKTNRGYKCRNKECQKKFSALVGSIFENTKIPLRTWFAAIWLCANNSKGISSVNLSKQLGIHQKSAWFLLHRIREVFMETSPEQLGGGGVIVETDTTWVGGKVKNMPKSKRRAIRGQSLGNANKTVVSGYVERGGVIRFDVLDKHESEKELVLKHIDKESVLMTDEANYYRVVGQQFAAHETVNHSIDQYVREKVFHTNTIEGAFSMFDRMIMGVYHYISPKHMQAYCNEVAFRYNTRKDNSAMKFEGAIIKCGGLRLKYNELLNR